MGASRALRTAPIVDWDRAAAVFGTPFFDAVRLHLGSFQGFPDVAALDALLAQRAQPVLNANGLALRFVDAGGSGRDAGGTGPRGYEELVYFEGRVGIRAGNWHDFFNAIAWLAWPRVKAALNQAHVRGLRQAPAWREPGGRGTARDSATLFDEAGAAVACADGELAGLLRDFRWKDLFVSRRAGVQDRLRCYIVGHSLMDKALAPYKGMTANALVFPVAPDFFSRPVAEQVEILDGLLAAWFAEPAHLDAAGPFSPLPLLGLPGYCGGNADPSYYDDAATFRPGRMRMTNQDGLRKGR
jgi:hypothetical protein